MKPLGLIAGEGVFPILVARGARAAGRKVICVGLHGTCWPELRAETDHFQEVGLLRIGKWIRVLKAHGCEEAIMVGRVKKSLMYDRWRYFRYIPDWRTIRMWFGRLRHDKRPRAVLDALADELASAGIALVDSTQYCKDQVCTPGVLTQRQPSAGQWQDIHYGWEKCRLLSRMDIGQSIAVLDRDVIAVEALEGTNAMIERAGQLCKTGGWTMIKVANGPEDARLDVPAVGTTTIEKLWNAGAACLVLDAGKTIILERTKTVELADRYKIAIVGYDPAHPDMTGQAEGAEGTEGKEMSLAYQAVQILYWLVLSVWLGSMVFLAAGAPVIFRAVQRLSARSGKYPDPALDEEQTTIVAGGVVGSLLDRLMQIQLICAGAMLPLMVGQILLIDLAATNRVAAAIRAALWLVALCIAFYEWRFHYPRTWSLRQQYLESSDDPEASNQARDQFHHEQHRSETLFQITVFLLIGLVVLSANIQPRPRGATSQMIEAGE